MLSLLTGKLLVIDNYTNIIISFIKTITRVRGITRRVSARRWEGDGFVALKTLKVVRTAAM